MSTTRKAATVAAVAFSLGAGWVLLQVTVPLLFQLAVYYGAFG
jgi:hypothetical protein